jgi:hypothetical protein
MKSDPFFFLQLLFFICDPKCSGIDSDGRMPFFSAATTHTNGYAIMEKGWGRGYGHEFKLVTKQDLVCWVGAPIWHSARDGCASSLHMHWLLEYADYDNIIANNMTLMQWRQIKGVFKLNNNLTTPGTGKEGYNPAAKYNLIFCTLCHNMNYFTLWEELDNAADELAWGFGSYKGNAGGRLMNKLVGKGGQTTMLFDVSRRYP